MDADAYSQEVLAEAEPRYLRRQKPLEIKRRKFGKKAWKTYLRAAAITGASITGLAAIYAAANFLLSSPDVALLHPDQIEVTGNHYIPRSGVLEIFAADRGKSVLRVPLEKRREQLESLPWVEQATVRRALPDRIEVELTERAPIAFLRQDSDMALVDVHGVILNRPLEGKFHFPVVTGLSPSMSQDDREMRMQLFSGFMKQVESVRSGTDDLISEVDLADASDLKVTMAGLPPAGGSSAASSGWSDSDGPLLVHFGDRDFNSRYQTLLDNIGQWRAAAGRIESVDLRFSREVVVNPEDPAISKQPAVVAAGRSH